MARLAGKVAVITGAASGLGLAAARKFVTEGARVLAVDVDHDSVNSAVATMGAEPGASADPGIAAGASAFVADLTDPEQARAAVEAAVDRYGGIDVLLPNAGIWGTVADLADYPIDTFRKVIDVNLNSVFYTMKSALPWMVQRGGGSIVLTSSAGGTGGKPGNVAYSATKHAVLGIMRTAAVEYAAAGIRVNAVLPGTIETPMIHRLEHTFSPDDPAAGAAELHAASLMRRYGTAEEVADLMLFLACDESSYCTGASYYVDGGFQLA